MVAWLMEQLLEWLSERVLDVLEFVMGVLGATVFVVPNVAALPQVRGIWSQNLTIVNTAYLLAIIAAGIVAMTHETVQVRYSVKDLLPRVVLGAVAANFSLTWCGMLLELADALSDLTPPAQTRADVTGPAQPPASLPMRRRAHPRQLRHHSPTSPHSRRRPSRQPRPAHHRPQPPALRHPHPRLRHPPHHRGPEREGDHPLPRWASISGAARRSGRGCSVSVGGRPRCQAALRLVARTVDDA
jgi:hypothetical protein